MNDIQNEKMRETPDEGHTENLDENLRGIDNEPKNESMSDNDFAFLKGMFIGMVVMFILSMIMIFIYKKQLRGSLTRADEQALISKIELLQGFIDNNYYSIDGEHTQAELFEGAYAGYVAALGDRYSAYYSPENYKKLQESNSGMFEGIGVYISLASTDEYPVITKVIEDLGAAEAGMLEEDEIIKVDGEDIKGWTMTQLTDKVRGEAGTDVVITVRRNGELIDLTVERSVVELDTVFYEMLEGNIGYIKVTDFDEVTVEQFNKAADALTEQGMTSLIIDLRDNPGGLLDTVIEVCSRILPSDKLIVYTEDKNGKREEYYTKDTVLADKSQDDLNIDVPIAVLINGGSASASEVFTGCMADYGKAKIIGEKSFGKGIVQSIFTMTDGSAVKLTTSYYFSPNGRNIHGSGFEPDIEATDDPETEDVDEVIEAAKDYLNS
ncbi:MAG: S41 family peptidase [Lachnospiraceae bacterium]|nr:S41 family peptidase [Lachnospiraceae bacterium]